MEDESHWEFAAQSDYISVVVDQKPYAYRTPRDFLRHSSYLSQLFLSDYPTCVVLPQAGFKTFLDWCRQFGLPSDLSMDRFQLTMTFALDFDVPILQNHLADRLRQNILDKKWKLSLETTCWAYSKMPMGMKVRKLFALSLYTTDVITDYRTEHKANKLQPQDDKAWYNLCCKLRDLGPDFVRILCIPDPKAKLMGTETCDFHNHDTHEGSGCLTIGKLWEIRSAALMQYNNDMMKNLQNGGDYRSDWLSQQPAHRHSGLVSVNAATAEVAAASGATGIIDNGISEHGTPKKHLLKDEPPKEGTQVEDTSSDMI